MEVNFARIYASLRNTVLLLASSAEVQKAYLDEASRQARTIVLADDIAEDFDNWVRCAPQLTQTSYLTQPILARLQALSEKVSAIGPNEGAWTAQALEMDAAWKAIREEAQSVLAEMDARYPAGVTPDVVVTGVWVPSARDRVTSLRWLVSHPVAWLVGASFVLALSYGLGQQAIWNAGAMGWFGATLKMSGIVVLAALAALGRANILVVYALIFGGAGDWLLAQNSTNSFPAGALAFALGHFCYIRAFWRDGASVRAAVAQPARAGAMLALVVGAGFGLWRLVPVNSVWFPGLAAYTGVLVLMALVALALPRARWLAMIGAVLFVISDGFVAAEVFYAQPNAPGVWFSRQFVGWMLYWAGQAALCVGMVNLGAAIPGAKA